MKISVLGIGYVGAVSAACLARDGHEVVAVDINEGKVRALNDGRSPIVEPGLDEIIRSALADGRLTATTDVEQAIAKTDISLVCVGTPARPNGSLETDHVERAAVQIGEAIARKKTFHSVVVRSTVLPGTMDELVIPALVAASGMTPGGDFGVGYFPEFLREGSAIADYDNPGAIVFGGLDDTTIGRLRDIHERFATEPCIIAIRAAEAIKYANNAWHALKISFANEIGLICKAMDVDSHDVLDVLCSDAKLNISRAYLTPGYAFGGSCLPKDVSALRHRARTYDVDTPLLDGVLSANENQIRQAHRMVAATEQRRVGLIGLSFKPETDDLRYSPLVELAERLIGRGFQVRIYDPIVRLSRLTGANKDYITQRLPHIAELLLEDPDELVSHSQVVVIGNRREAAPLLPALEAAGVTLIDLVRVDRNRGSGGQYEGLCW